MTLFLLDPNLDHPNGHHLDWDLAIAKAAGAHGVRSVILAHRDYPASLAAGIEIRPWFTFTTYQAASTDPLTGRYDDFRLFNDRLAMDLAALPTDTFRAEDAILAPTLTERHLLGYAAWMKRFDPVHAPLFALHLMFPPGPEEMVRLLYRLALREVDRPGPFIHIFGTGRERAAEFSELLGRSVPAHPLPLAPIRSTPRASGARPSCLLFLGDAKADKGIALLPAVAERLAGRHRDWDFGIHVNEATAWADAQGVLADLRDIARHHPNIALRTEWLDRASYEGLLGAADALVCLHDPDAYARKSSGILWEAVSAGLPLVVPHGSWLEREAVAWCAGFVPSHRYDVAGFCEAFAELVERRGALADAARQAADRFRSDNGAERLVGQLLPLWRANSDGAMAAPADREAAYGVAARTIPRPQVTKAGDEAEVTFPWAPGAAFNLDITSDDASEALPVEGAETALLSDHGEHRSGRIRLRIAVRRPRQTPAAFVPAAVGTAVNEPVADAPPEGFAINGVRGRIVRVDELLDLRDAEYRHLDLSIHDLVSDGILWPHVKFRLCNDRGLAYLEFRRMSGWPLMFVTWPGTERDRYGDVLRIPADGTPLPLGAPDDTALLGALARSLRAIVAALAARHPERTEEWPSWMDEAAIHERSMTERWRGSSIEVRPESSVR